MKFIWFYHDIKFKVYSMLHLFVIFGTIWSMNALSCSEKSHFSYSLNDNLHNAIYYVLHIGITAIGVTLYKLSFTSDWDSKTLLQLIENKYAFNQLWKQDREKENHIKSQSYFNQLHLNVVIKLLVAQFLQSNLECQFL